MLLKSARVLLAGAASVSILALGAAVASAATTVVVTPANPQGWSTADTRAGGTVTFVADPSSPLPDGALELETDATTAAKAQYLHEASGPLSDVNELSYSARTIAGPVHASASYQLVVDLNGAAEGGFTTLVYEPYQNGGVVAGWHEYDVDAGLMWSSRTFSEGTCAVVAGAGGPPFYTLAQLQTACPDAVVLGFGVNVGTFNPGYTVLVDGVTFNGTVYDFELVNTPADTDACKSNGWSTLTNADGESFKNQGDCIQFANTGK
jgi:hypothetical protein